MGICLRSAATLPVVSLSFLVGELLLLIDRYGGRRKQGLILHAKISFAGFHTPSDRELWRSRPVRLMGLQTAKELCAGAVSVNHRWVWLLGVGVTGFCGNRLVQQTLPDEEGDECHGKQRQLNRVADAVRERCGAAALSRGSGVIREPWR